jgi:hypothetical protein
MRAALLIVVSWLLTPAEAIACDCSKESYSDRYATVIFKGEIAEVEGPDTYGVSLVRFKVLELQRGPYAEFITIRVQNYKTTSCNPNAASFKVGERYLMSASKLMAAAPASDEARAELARRPLYFNHYCGLRQRFPVTPNTSLERTREDEVPSPSSGVRAAQLNR